MRYTPDHKQKTRARILGAAGRVFRRQGYHASGVDKVMEEAGLTAGGFYAHFDSKQALLALVLEHAAAETGERLAASTENLSGREWIEAFLRRYLNKKHRREIEKGCPLAALVSEVARADAVVKASFESIVRELEYKLASHAEQCGAAVAADRALAMVALCVGGLGLARSVQDERFAERIVRSCRSMAMELLCAGGDVDLKPRQRGDGKNS